MGQFDVENKCERGNGLVWFEDVEVDCVTNLSISNIAGATLGAWSILNRAQNLNVVRNAHINYNTI